MKRFSILVFIVVVLAAYAAGVSYTGQQAEQALEEELSRLQSRAPFPVALNLIGQRGFFASNYRLEVILDNPPAEVRQLLGGDIIPFDLAVSNGFLTADYLLRFSPGVIQDHLLQWQNTASNALPEFRLALSLDPFNQTLSHQSSLNSPALTIPLNQGTFVFGELQADAEFSAGELNMAANFEGLELTVPAGRFAVGVMTLEQHAVLVPGTDLHSGQYATAHAQLLLGPVMMDAMRSQFRFQSLTMEMQQQADAPRLYLDSRSRIDGFEMQDKTSDKHFEFNHMLLDSRLDVDLAAAMALTATLAQMTPQQASDPLTILPVLDSLTRQGVTLQFNQVELESEHGRLNATGDVVVGNLALDQLMADPNLLQKRLLIDLELAMDIAMVTNLDDPQVTGRLEHLKAEGYLVEQAGKLTSRIQLEQGELRINEILVGKL
ncbi:DUF945 family protein [Pontibacter sp. JAM-7]|uniref:DUF945 family protein n=1 Tax=Pontibacter sp. JAM-7 TaxID=3366581 RepID=UPI003AF40D3D